MKTEHKKKLNNLESELNKHIELSQEQSKQLQNLRIIEEKLKHELKSLETQKTELEVEITYNLQEITNLKTQYEKETTALSQNLRKCRKLINKKLIFNDESNEFFNSLNSSKKSLHNVRDSISFDLIALLFINFFNFKCCLILLFDYCLLDENKGMDQQIDSSFLSIAE